MTIASPALETHPMLYNYSFLTLKQGLFQSLLELGYSECAPTTWVTLVRNAGTRALHQLSGTQITCVFTRLLGETVISQGPPRLSNRHEPCLIS